MFENSILSKRDEIITHNKVTKKQSIGEREEQVLHIVKDGVTFEGNIIIIIEEERDNDYCGAILEAQNRFYQL